MFLQNTNNSIAETLLAQKSNYSTHVVIDHNNKNIKENKHKNNVIDILVYILNVITF